MSGYGSKRRVMVIALMVGALSTGVGFVALSGRWVPTAEMTVDVQGTAPLLSRVPCVVASGLPCVPTVPSATVANASVTMRADDVPVAGGRPADHSVVAATPDGPVSMADSATKDTDVNVVQPDLLLARSAGNSGSIHPGGEGAVLAGSSAGNGSLGSHTRGISTAVGVVNGSNASPTSEASSASSSIASSTASSSTSSSSSSSLSSTSGASSGVSTPSSAPTSETTFGTLAWTPIVPPIATDDVPPVLVDHDTTVSDLTRGRTGTPISIVVGGAGEPMSSTPEPSSLLLIGTGVVGLGAFLKRRRAAAGTTPRN